MIIAMSTIGRLRIACSVGFSELVGVSDCVPRKKMPLKPAWKLLAVICTRKLPEPTLSNLKVPLFAVVVVALTAPLEFEQRHLQAGDPILVREDLTALRSDASARSRATPVP